MARERNVNLQGALTWAFTFVDQPWFAGFRQLATNGVDLPVLNVFRLFSRMGSEQLSATSSGQLPLDQVISEGVRAQPDIGVMATRADNGRLEILLWHYRDDDVPAPNAEVRVTLTGLMPRSQLHGRIWRVDEGSGNAFAAWRAMGSPPRPTPAQIDRLLGAANMIEEPLSVRASDPSGGLSFGRLLASQAVELIELDP